MKGLNTNPRASLGNKQANTSNSQNLHANNKTGTHSNGTNGHRRSNSRATSSSSMVAENKGTKEQNKEGTDKVTFLVAKSIGKKCIATVSSGSKIQGTLLSADLQPSAQASLAGISIVLSNPTVISKAITNEKSNLDKVEDIPDKIIIKVKDLMDFEVQGVDLSSTESEAKIPSSKIRPMEAAVSSPTSSQNFKTDKDISGQKELKEKKLQRWVPEDDSFNLSLDDNTNASESWDQFKVNEEKFGVQSSYDEHLYTTKINKSAPDFQKRLQQADKIAKEIESQASSDRHVLEERGLLVDDSGFDEEDKYSGVDRRGNELMAALKGSNVLKEVNSPDLKTASEHDTATQKAANYHDDPAIISSSATAASIANSRTPTPLHAQEGKSVAAERSKKDSRAKQQSTKQSSDTFRLNAESEINSLKEFSANFKVPHKLPNDLLPILAKDKVKQDEILRKKKEESLSPHKSEHSGLRATTGKTEGSKSPDKTKFDSSHATQRRRMDPTKPAFKLNPKAASFTPSTKTLDSQTSPNLPKSSFQQKISSPRMNNQRANTSGSNSSVSSSVNFKRHHQITPADFFGGAEKIPTKEGQIKKSKEWKNSFNLFLTVEKKSGSKKVPASFEKTFQTPPTWDFTTDITHDALFPSPSSLKGSAPLIQNAFSYIPSPVPGTPNMTIPGGFGGVTMLQESGNFPMTPQQQQQAAALAHFQQQQFHAAMMYQQQQFSGAPPSQPGIPMYNPSPDSPFMPAAGFVVQPGAFVGATSPINGSMMMVGNPYNGTPAHMNNHSSHHNFNGQGGSSRRYSGNHHHQHNKRST